MNYEIELSTESVPIASSIVLMIIVYVVTMPLSSSNLS